MNIRLSRNLRSAVSVTSAELKMTPEQFILSAVLTGVRAMADHDPIIRAAVARYGIEPVRN